MDPEKEPDTVSSSKGRTSGLHPGNASSILTEITMLPLSPTAGRRILIPETLVRLRQGPPRFVSITAIISDCLSEDAGSIPARIAIGSSRLKGQDTGPSIRRCEFESREDHHHALLTQWAEYSSDTRAVRGSNPRGRTTKPFRLKAGCRTLIPEV